MCALLVLWHLVMMMKGWGRGVAWVEESIVVDDRILRPHVIVSTINIIVACSDVSSYQL